MKTPLLILALLLFTITAVIYAQSLLGLDWSTAPAAVTVTIGATSETSYNPAPGVMVDTQNTTLTRTAVQRMVMRVTKTTTTASSESTVFLPVPTPETGY